jgi:hypothetical protein
LLCGEDGEEEMELDPSLIPPSICSRVFKARRDQQTRFARGRRGKRRGGAKKTPKRAAKETLEGVLAETAEGSKRAKVEEGGAPATNPVVAEAVVNPPPLPDAPPSIGVVVEGEIRVPSPPSLMDENARSGMPDLFGELL